MREVWKKARSLSSIIHQRLGRSLLLGELLIYTGLLGLLIRKEAHYRPAAEASRQEIISYMGRRISENLCSSFQSLAYRKSSLLPCFCSSFHSMWPLCEMLFTLILKYHIYVGISKSYLHSGLKYSYPLDIASNWLHLKLNTFLSFNIHLLPNKKG